MALARLHGGHLLQPALLRGTRRAPPRLALDGDLHELIFELGIEHLQGDRRQGSRSGSGNAACDTMVTLHIAHDGRDSAAGHQEIHLVSDTPRVGTSVVPALYKARAAHAMLMWWQCGAELDRAAA